MIITPQAYALTLAATDSGRLPVIGWHSLVTASNIEATSEAEDYPASNLANASTKNRWGSESTATQYVTVLFSGEAEVDYVAIARHNWGSTGATVSVEAVELGDDPETDGDWGEIVAERVLADDAPAVWRMVPGYYIGVRIKIQPVDTAPTAAVLKVGKLIVLQRGVQVHTPITYGRRRTVVNGKAQSGDFLGRIITGGSLTSSVNIQFLTPDWYRDHLDEFVEASAEDPFFFAWNPEEYPAEVGYCWLTNDLVPQVSHLAGYIDLTMELEGLAV